MNNSNKIVMSIEGRMLWEELQIQKSMLQTLIDKQVECSLEEVSVNKAARILKHGYDFVLGEITTGHLPARAYTIKGVTRYRIKVSSLQKYLRASRVTEIKTHSVEPSEVTFLKLRKNIVGV